MNVLGIDPGLANLGWGVVSIPRPSRFQYLGCGRFSTKPRRGVPPLEDMYRRIDELTHHLELLRDEYDLDGAAFEGFTLYGHQDQGAFIQTANVTGMVRTMFRRLGARHYLPQTVKATVAGARNAKKPEVKRAVCRILDWTPAFRTTDHAIDALAVAICHGLCGGSRHGA